MIRGIGGVHDGMTHAFTDEERAFLRAGSRTGKLAYTASDGRPLVVPIWYVLDGDDVVFNTGTDSAKAKAIRRDPRVALCVDLEAPPYGFVQIQAVAQTSGDVAAMLPHSIAIGARYMGAERGEEFGRRNAVEGELLVRLTPVKVISAMNVTA
jgi:PPOX class probable F420-dependent enzyme